MTHWEMMQVEVYVNTGCRVVVVQRNPYDRDDDDAVELSPDQVDLVCIALQRAKKEAIEAISKAGE